MKPVQTLIPPEFDDLPFGEKLLMWGMRLWVRAHNNNEDGHEFLRSGFKLAGISAAHPQLDSMMSILVTSGSGHIGVRAPHCTEISMGEHRLLAAIAAWQYDSGPEMSDLYLACWLPEKALKAIRGPMANLAAVMCSVGLYVRPRPGTALVKEAIERRDGSHRRSSITPITLH